MGDTAVDGDVDAVEEGVGRVADVDAGACYVGGDAYAARGVLQAVGLGVGFVGRRYPSGTDGVDGDAEGG